MTDFKFDSKIHVRVNVGEIYVEDFSWKDIQAEYEEFIEPIKDDYLHVSGYVTGVEEYGSVYVYYKVVGYRMKTEQELKRQADDEEKSRQISAIMVEKDCGSWEANQIYNLRQKGLID